MDIFQKINALNQSKLNIENNFLMLTDEFKLYISDKNIPILERWDLFVSAPDMLSQQLDSFPSFHYKNLGPGLTFFMKNLLTEEHVNALDNGSNTIKIKESVEQWFDRQKNDFNIKSIRISLENNQLTDKELNDFMWQLMEELLQLNLASFDYGT